MDWSANATSSRNSSSGWIPCLSSPYGIQTFFAVELINFVFGLPVNAWTVWLIAHSSRSIQAPEVFTLNLALLECVYSSLSFLRPVNYYFINSVFLHDFNLFFYGLLSSGRPLLQGCVCLERYLGVVHPVTYLRYNSLRVRLCVLPAVWCFTLLFCVCNVLKLVLVFPCLFLPLLLLQGYCCIRILQVLRQPGPGVGGGADPTKKKAFITVLVIQVMLVLNYLPVVLALPLTGQLSRHGYTCQLAPAALSFSVFGSFVQPVMYLIRTGRLRRAGEG